MDRYHLALFLHLLTLIVAAGVTAVTKLAAARRIRARTVGEALDWHNVLMGASRLFPICLAVFLGSGVYMLGVAAVPWTSAFAVAGYAGVLFLFASGTYLGIKGKALKQVLETIAAKGAHLPAPKKAPPPLVPILPLVNTGVAIGVVFDMVTKPTSVGVALGVIALAAVASAIGAVRAHPAPAEASVEAPASAL